MNFTPLKDYMSSLLNRGVPGCELIVCRDHEILFHECAGYSDEAGTRPAASSDQYLLYSCTKPVTAAAAMQCCERGLFDLDDPVSKYLPAYENAFVMKDAVRAPVSRPVTIRHLQTMTAGLNYDFSAPIARLLERVKEPTTRQFAEALVEAPLDFEPGERFQYSLCHDVLAAVIEAASKMTYAEYVQRNILDPLGMEDSGFWTPGSVWPNLVAQYAYNAAENKVTARGRGNDLVLSPNMHSGGGGMVATMSDYIRFADALACGESAGGTMILSEASINLMRSEQLPSFRVSGNFTCTCGDDYGYGLGVRTRVAFNHGGQSAPGEFGWDGAAGVDLLVDPEHRLSMVYGQSVLNWPPMLGAVHLQIRDILYPALGL